MINKDRVCGERMYPLIDPLIDETGSASYFVLRTSFPFRAKCLFDLRP